MFRSSLYLAAGALALAGVSARPGRAQMFRVNPPTMQPGGTMTAPLRSTSTFLPLFAPAVANQQVNAGFYLAPGLTIAQAAFNTRVTGSAMRSIPPYAFGNNPYPQFVNIGTGLPLNPTLPGTMNPGTTGTLTTAGSMFTGSPFGLYAGGVSGAALAAGAYGGGYGGGYGAALQTGSPYGGGYGGGYGSSGYGGYYEDPYTGYLRGAAQVTNSQGQYLSQVQQARLLQVQADSAKLDLRHRIAEEAAAERRNWLNPETERVKELHSAYERATREPPITEILSGQALNDLYNHVYPVQAKRAAQGVKAPDVPVNEDMLRQINFTGVGSGGSVALLKNAGRLNWPLALQSPQFDEPRKELTALVGDAASQARLNNPVAAGTLRDMIADVRRMNETLLHDVGDFPPNQYVDAKRYLNQLEGVVKALRDPNAGNQLNQSWTPRARTVAELVDFMGQKGLKFAPATAGDEPAYRHLYQQFLAFDGGTAPQIATTKP